jgi:glycosyltransferase involved in cell wall biosynthesis
MKITAVCITYLRPALLAELIRMFELQTYQDRELIVLDDAGQYREQVGDRWRIVPWEKRFFSLGAKRNQAMRLASDDSEAFAVWDDDDVYLPWALEATVNGLEKGDWAAPSVAFDHWELGKMIVTRTGIDASGRHNAPAYHGSWSYRRSAIEDVGGYPEREVGDLDCETGISLIERFGHPVDTICDEYPHPYYIYNRFAQTYNAGEMTDKEITDMNEAPCLIDRVIPKWPTSYDVLWGSRPVEERRW